jgi:hypothetical protein
MAEPFYLQCNNEFDKVAKLGSITADVEILSKAGTEEARSATKVGWYSRVDGRLVCLCRLDGVPWLRIDDFAIPMEDEVHVFWDLAGLPRHEGPITPSRPWKPGRVTVNPAARGFFRVEKAGKVLLSFEYPPFREREIFVGDMTPYLTEEDYDSMLFVWRVLEDPGRRARFYRPQVT